MDGTTACCCVVGKIHEMEFHSVFQLSITETMFLMQNKPIINLLSFSRNKKLVQIHIRQQG